ncbi:MAG: AMIN domain-containing protein, partial [Burkholderiaceae bacterium]|nr:AMIN domain-containing protein [Burkholderiaceae bacterium]
MTRSVDMGVVIGCAARWAFALVFAAAAGAAAAQGNAIESVTAASQGATTLVRIKLASPLKEQPPSFSVSSPARVAVDFTATENKTGQSTIELSQGDVRSVSLVQSGGRSRVVLNLRKPATYTTSIEGNTVIVALTAMVESAGATQPLAYSFAQSGSKSTHALRDIDFRRGREGEGRVVIDLSDAGVGVNVRQQGQAVIVDFLATKLPDNLRRRLDVGDFGTPVRTVRATQDGENTRIVIEPQGQWEHNAYQSDTQFVVEVKPVRDDPNRLATQQGYRGERLSLSFQNVDVRALLQVIADFTNLNIVSSDSVTGSVTLRLKDVPWDQALDIVLQSKGLDMRKNGNVILVAPSTEFAAKEKLDLETRMKISEIEQLRTEVFQLNYQKAENLAKLLSNEKQRVLSKRGSAVFDARTNKIFIQDTAANLEDVRKLIAQVDVSVRQVLIEARIVEADDRFSRNLGARLGFNDTRATVTRQVAVTDPASGALTSMNVPVYGAGTSLVGNAYASISG